MILLWAIAALAAPLGLDDVRASVDARVPALAAAEAKLAEAEAKLLSTRGAFDPTLVGQSKSVTGKDPRHAADTALVVATPLGPAASVGWRRGVGDFPAYDGEAATAEAGEIRAGIEIPLLEGLGMGAARAALQQGRLGTAEADAVLKAKRLQVHRKAEAAWWKWVAAGAKLQVAQQQLDLAEQRDRALRVEVEQGSRAPLEQFDNERVLFERRAAVASATREVQVAAVVLSLWYRDDSGRPVVVGTDRLPPLQALEPPNRETDKDIEAARARPDVAAARVGVDRAAVVLRRGRNQVLPKLTAKTEVRQDLTDEPTELVVGLDVSMPTLLRKGRGERDRAAAAVTGLRQTLRGMEDQVEAEVRAAHHARTAALEQVTWTARAAEQAERVRALQQRSWELGDSDLFVLLQREEKLAKARKSAVDARFDLAMADLDLRASVGELGQ